MSDTIEHIILKETWSEEDRATLLAACTDDPSLSHLLQNWSAIRSEVRRSILEATSEVEIFINYAIATSKSANVFSDSEVREAVSQEAKVETAIARHPAVSLLLEKIREDAAAFDLTWKERNRSTGSRPDREPTARRSSARRLTRWSYGISAGLAIVATAAILLRPVSSDVSISSGPSETRLIQLEDGSVVRLMANSSIAYAEHFGREVRLSGRAFFDVAHSSTEFNVRTENAVITVHGTSFGINSNDHDTQVTLVTGSVSLSSAVDPSLSVELQPGEFSRILGPGSPTDPMTIDVADALSWTDLFIFRNTPLRRIANTLAKELAVSIVLSSELEDETVTGTFSRDQGADEILDVIAAALGARVTYDEAAVTYTLLP